MLYNRLYSLGNTFYKDYHGNCHSLYQCYIVQLRWKQVEIVQGWLQSRTTMLYNHRMDDVVFIAYEVAQQYTQHHKVSQIHV